MRSRRPGQEPPGAPIRRAPRATARWRRRWRPGPIRSPGRRSRRPRRWRRRRSRLEGLQVGAGRTGRRGRGARAVERDEDVGGRVRVRGAAREVGEAAVGGAGLLQPRDRAVGLGRTAGRPQRQRRERGRVGVLAGVGVRVRRRAGGLRGGAEGLEAAVGALLPDEPGDGRRGRGRAGGLVREQREGLPEGAVVRRVRRAVQARLGGRGGGGRGRREGGAREEQAAGEGDGRDRGRAVGPDHEGSFRVTITNQRSGRAPIRQDPPQRLPEERVRGARGRTGWVRARSAIRDGGEPLAPARCSGSPTR